MNLRSIARLGVKASKLSRRRMIAAIAVGALCWASGDQGHMARGAVKRPKPWFEAKSAFIFPLGRGPLPGSGDELADSLTRGYRSSLRFPDNADIVQTDGNRFPALRSLRIMLDNGIIQTNKDPRKNPPLKPTGKVERHLDVRHFDLNAEPLVREEGKLNIRMSATDARLDVEHDEKGRPLLLLGDARSASLDLHMTRQDLERMLKSDLNDLTIKYGVAVMGVKLSLDAKDDRSIDLDLHVSARVAIVPAGMRFTAHVDIADDMSAKLSHLKCEGDEALGFLIVNLIRPGLKKYEGMSRQVVAFPSGDLALKSVKIVGGDEIGISAKFGR